MTVSFIGAQGAAATTVTIPAHQSGDLILIFAYRDGNNTAPTTPTAGGTVPTWNSIGSSGGNTNSSSFAWARATASTTTSGTWTNATELICLVYRGASIGASVGGSGAATTTINYPALTLNRTNNTSWAVGVAGHRTANNVEVAPSGMTNRASAGTEAAGHDTNGTVSSWSSTNVTVNASSAYRSWVVELRDQTLTDNATVGAFTLTGQPADLRHNPDIEAGVGSFTLAGQPATTRHNVRIDGGVGSFTLAGQPAATLHNPRVDGGVGSFTLTGQPATLSKSAAAKSLAADTGAFALSGGATGLLVGSAITGGVGSFTLTGNPAGLVIGSNISGDVGKFFLPERNLRQWSEEFNNAYWTKTNASITANATAAPDGTLTADTLIENTVNSTHTVGRNTSFKADVRYTCSLYVKTYQNRNVAIVIGTTAAFGGTVNTAVVFSPSTNTFLLTNNEPEAYGSEDVGNGWYRIYITKTAIATATTNSTIQVRTGTTGTYAGDGTSGIYIWGAQFEEGDLTNYDPTGATVATNAALIKAYRIDGGVGAFTLAGQPALLNKGRTIAADVAAFTLTGQPATLRHNARIDGGVGSFALAGQPVSLIKLNAYRVDAARGAFILAGQPAIFRYNQSIAAAAGAFTLVGNSITLTKSGTTRRRNVLIF